MLQHIGYLHGVTGQPPQCPSSCREDEYRYYYEQGWRILQGTAGFSLEPSATQPSATRVEPIESEQLERRIAA
jgi:hypothetical protein